MIVLSKGDNTMMYYTFDIAYDCPVQDFLSILAQFNLRLDSFIPEGPGGGNPEITVYGSYENIENLKKFL
jgi:hypothetical protein